MMDMDVKNDFRKSLPNKGRAPTTKGNMTFLQQIGTPTLQNRSNNNHWVLGDISSRD